MTLGRLRACESTPLADLRECIAELAGRIERVDSRVDDLVFGPRMKTAPRPRGRPPSPPGTHRIQIRGSLSPAAATALARAVADARITEDEREEIDRLLAPAMLRR